METQEEPEGILLERVIDAFCSLLDAAVPDAFCALPRVLSLFRDSVFVDRLEAYATDVTADEEPEPGQRDAVIFGIVWGLDAVKFQDAIAGWICDYVTLADVAYARRGFEFVSVSHPSRGTAASDSLRR